MPRRRNNVIHIIPEEGEVDVDKLTKYYGSCLRSGCGGRVANLQRHYLNNHGANEGRMRVLLNEIPDVGDVDVKALTMGWGFCYRGRNKQVANVKRHFNNNHGANEGRQRVLLREIPEVSDVDPQSLYSGNVMSNSNI